MSREKMAWIVCVCCLAVFWFSAWAADIELMGAPLVIFGTVAILLFTQFFLAGRRSLLETTIWLLVIIVIFIPSENYSPTVLFVYNQSQAPLDVAFLLEQPERANVSHVKAGDTGFFKLGKDVEISTNGRCLIFAMDQTGKVVYSCNITETDKEKKDRYCIVITQDMLNTYSANVMEKDN